MRAMFAISLTVLFYCGITLVVDLTTPSPPPGKAQASDLDGWLNSMEAVAL